MAKPGRAKAKKAGTRQANKPAKRTKKGTKRQPQKKKERTRGNDSDTVSAGWADQAAAAEPSSHDGGEDFFSERPAASPRDAPRKVAGGKKKGGRGKKGAKRPSGKAGKKKVGKKAAPKQAEGPATYAYADESSLPPEVPSPALSPSLSPAQLSPPPSSPPQPLSPHCESNREVTGTPTMTPAVKSAATPTATPFASFTSVLRRMGNHRTEVPAAMSSTKAVSTLQSRLQPRRLRKPASDTTAKPSPELSPPPQPSPPPQRAGQARPRRRSAPSAATSAPNSGVHQSTAVPAATERISPQAALVDTLSDALTEEPGAVSPVLTSRTPEIFPTGGASCSKEAHGNNMQEGNGPHVGNSHVDNSHGSDSHVSLSFSVGLDGHTSLSFSVGGGGDEGADKTAASPEQGTPDHSHVQEVSARSNLLGSSAKHGDSADEVQESLLARLGQMLSNLFAPSEAPEADAQPDHHEASDARAHDNEARPSDTGLSPAIHSPHMPSCEPCSVMKTATHDPRMQSGLSTGLKASVSDPATDRITSRATSPTSVVDVPLNGSLTGTLLW